MAYQYTFIDGERVEVHVAAAFRGWAADFLAETGCSMHVSSGVRTESEQAAGRADYLAGRTDVKWAKPSESSHCEVGPAGPRALDLRDSGADAGVTVKGSHRWNVAVRLGKKYGFTWGGWGVPAYEGWHFENHSVTVGGSVGSGAGASAGWNQTSRSTADIQRAVGANPDGIWGPQTESYIKASQAAWGLEPDGIWGALTDALTFLTVDGDWGDATTRRVQKAFGVPIDGEMGPATWSAIQKHLGVTVDGEPGPQTYKALQRALKVTADGDFGPASIKALQSWLIRGGRLVPVPDPGDTGTTPTTPTGSAATPRTPVYPGAAAGWTVPLSSDRAPGAVITTLFVHHETAFSSQVEYFKKLNERGSCPTWEVDGKVVTEMIDPAKKPSATGRFNASSVAIETVNVAGEPDWKVSEDSVESIAQIAAWLSQQSNIGGVPVRFTLDREHIKGHKEADPVGNPTRCPGEYLFGRLDYIVARARAIVADVVTPEPDPDTVPVDRSWLQSIADKIKKLLGGG